MSPPPKKKPNKITTTKNHGILCRQGKKRPFTPYPTLTPCLPKSSWLRLKFLQRAIVVFLGEPHSPLKKEMVKMDALTLQ